MSATPKLTPKMAQLLAAIREGATLRYAGWQEVRVTYGPADERNYIARQSTLYALRDRGLVELGSFGVRLVTTTQED